MSVDIDQLSAALRNAYPEITVERVRVSELGAEESTMWRVNHPSAVTDVQVGSATAGAAFVVESGLAPPTVARTVDQAVRLITERMGLRIGAG